MSTTVELHRVKAELAALRAGIEALAVEYELGGGFVAANTRAALNVAAYDLRGLLGDPA